MFGIFEAVIFLCIVYYFFNNASAYNMLDAIQTKANEIWRTERPATTIFATSALSSANEKIRREMAMKKETYKKNLDYQLYKIKESAPPVIQPATRTVVGLSCKHCTPGGGGESQLDPAEKRRDVVDILKVTKHAGVKPDGSKWDWGTWFPYVAQSLRFRGYDYAQVAGTVLEDKRMKDAIHQAAKNSVAEKKEKFIIAKEEFNEESYYAKMLKKHELRAARLLIELRSAVSHFLLRTSSWIMYTLLPWFLSGVAAHPAHIDMLKAANAKMPNVPMIFLPLHRSHLDYILVTFILANNDMRAPLVAAGNNLNITVFGRLLRGLGAFFIKRKIDPVAGKKDLVYRALLHTYMQKCLTAGHNIEFFIEGGRTRTGKPCMPKSGVLSVIIDACMDGSIPDALLVPVSINYEKLVDGNFVHEQLGQKKKAESFLNAMSAIWRTLNSRYGLMRIDFNEPVSLRTLVKRFSKTSEAQKLEEKPLLQHNLSTSSLYGTDVVQEEHRTLVENIAKHVVYDCASATSIMTTNALAFLLLTQFRDGATMSVLVEALNRLRYDVQGKRDLGFVGSSEDVIRYAANLLGPGLVTIEKRGVQTFIKPITMVPNVIELFYYSNTVTTFYALESVIVTSAVNLLKKYSNNGTISEDVKIPESELCDLSRELCDMLRYEFIFCKPCQNLNTMIADTINNLSYKGVVAIPVIERTEEEDRALRLATYVQNDCGIYDDSDEFSDCDKTYHQMNEPTIQLPADKHCDRLVLMNVIAPVSHTYLAVATTLQHLIGCNSIIENEFVKQCVIEITNRVERGSCKFGESISTDSIRNCIKLLEKWNIVDISTRTGARLLSLNPVYDSIIGVKHIINRISKFVQV